VATKSGKDPIPEVFDNDTDLRAGQTSEGRRQPSRTDNQYCAAVSGKIEVSGNRIADRGTIMAAYVIFDVLKIDYEAIKPYIEKAFDTIIPYGGRLVARTDNIEVREGDWRPNRILMIEFPDMQSARDWYESPEYQEILPIRLAATEEHMIIVEGLPND
jgi:uncharacterized protein (DUF1330 family)